MPSFFSTLATSQPPCIIPIEKLLIRSVCQAHFPRGSRRLYSNRFLQCQRFDSPLAQDELLHFAARGHGIVVNELEVARDLLVADLALAIVAQFLLCQLFPFLETYHGQHFLAEEFIGYAENLYISDLRMANQKLLDLAWENVFTPANHHLLETTNNIDVPPRIHCCQVTCVEPPVTVDGLSSLLRHLVVAQHDEVATAAQLTTLAARHYLTSGRIDDLDLDMSYGCSYS